MVTDSPPTNPRPGYGCGWLLAAFMAGVFFLPMTIIPALRIRAVGDRRKVEAVLQSQADAWNRGDLEGFMAGYRPDGDLTFFSSGTVTTGWQATLDRYRKRYQADGAEMGRLGFSDLAIEMYGDGPAIVRGRWELTTSKGKPGGLFTLILHKINGEWKIVHDHTSAADPPKPQ